MDGPFYVDTRGPHNYTSTGTITLTNVLQAVLPAAAYANLGGNYFNWVGKAVRMKTFGQITTGATPGNVLMQYMWGNGTSNTGTNIGGANITGVANVANAVFWMESIFRCRVCGASGQLFG